jgi:hypothetical protein
MALLADLHPGGQRGPDHVDLINCSPRLSHVRSLECNEKLPTHGLLKQLIGRFVLAEKHEWTPESVLESTGIETLCRPDDDSELSPYPSYGAFMHVQLVARRYSGPCHCRH